MPARTHRLFVAVYPPHEVGAAILARGLAALDARPDRSRPTPEESLHLTVFFIGETDERQLDEVRESVARSASGLDAFTLTPERLLTLPERGPARLLAAMTDAPAPLLELHRRLAHRLARSPRARAGDAFRPHLTLLRLPPGSGTRVDEPLEAGHGFRVDRLRLMRSVLRPSGAEHHELAAFPLGL